MTSSRTENTKRNIIYGMLNMVLSLLLPFLARTVLLRVLGEEYLGLNSLFTSVLQVLNLAELGLSSAIVYCLYKPIAEDNKEIICAYLKLYKKTYNVIGLVIGLIGIIIIPVLPYLINATTINVNVYLLYLIYLTNTVIGYFLFAYKSTLLVAHQRSDIISNIATIINIFKYGLQIAILFLTKNYYIYIIVLPITSVINNLIVAFIVHKKYPEYVATGTLVKGEKDILYSRIKGIFLTKICGVLRDSADTIIISIFLTLTDVAIFSNYFYILSSVHSLMIVITASMRAGVGNSLVVETPLKNYQDLSEFTYYYALITAVTTACLIGLYQPFMRMWVGDSLVCSKGTMFLFVAYFYFLCSMDIRNVYIEAAGLWYEFRKRAILELISNLTLNIILVHLWGLAGILFATIITFFFINIIYGSSVFIKKLFDKKYREYMFTFFKYLFLTGCITVSAYFLSDFIPTGNIGWLIIRGLGVVAFSGGLFLLLTIKSNYLKLGMKRLKNLFKKNGYEKNS